MTAFPIYDAHGNNVASLTRSGTGFSVGDRRTYDAWGVVRAQQSGGDPKLRYCGALGHKADDESGLIYMRARYYEPSSGRFVSEDPGKQGSNLFVYCADNPANGVDQSGKGVEELTTIFNNCSDTFKKGMYEAWDTGDLDNVVQYIVDHWQHELVAFNVGGPWYRLASGYGMKLRIEAVMLEDLLGDGVIENAGSGIVTCENELGGLGRLVAASQSAHEVGE